MKTCKGSSGKITTQEPQKWPKTFAQSALHLLEIHKWYRIPIESLESKFFNEKLFTQSGLLLFTVARLWWSTDLSVKSQENIPHDVPQICRST